MSENIDYIAVAKQGGLPLKPNPSISFEVQLVGSKDQNSFNETWNVIKEQYNKYLAEGDNNGIILATSRLRLLVTAAQEKGWEIDGQTGPFYS